MLGGVCYVDKFAGNSDSGYSVSSYREVNPALGTIEDLKDLSEALREVFPDQHPGGFSQLPDGRRVSTTFNSFQWDLNYGDPAVFTAMAAEMLAIANLGTEFLRMDAVAFVGKRLGTPCENLPEVHTLIRAFSALDRFAAPGLPFKSEAIVHPDDVVKYISSAECQISYNPLQMALLWNTLATCDVNQLQQALESRHNLAPDTAWVNYVRSHDDPRPSFPGHAAHDRCAACSAIPAAPPAITCWYSPISAN